MAAHAIHHRQECGMFANGNGDSILIVFTIADQTQIRMFCAQSTLSALIRISTLVRLISIGSDPDERCSANC
jgi:hypothetical protein